MFFETVSLSWNLICRSGWPQLTNILPASASWIKGLCHHAWLMKPFRISKFHIIYCILNLSQGINLKNHYIFLLCACASNGMLLRLEYYLPELVLSFHHVGLRDLNSDNQTWHVTFPSKPSCQTIHRLFSVFFLKNWKYYLKN